MPLLLNLGFFAGQQQPLHLQLRNCTRRPHRHRRRQRQRQRQHQRQRLRRCSRSRNTLSLSRRRRRRRCCRRRRRRRVRPFAIAEFSSSPCLFFFCVLPCPLFPRCRAPHRRRPLLLAPRFFEELSSFGFVLVSCCSGHHRRCHQNGKLSSNLSPARSPQP